MSVKDSSTSIKSEFMDKSIIPARYVFAFLGFFGFINVYTLRINLSVAIIAMVNESSHSSQNDSENVVACPELLKDFSYANTSAKNHSLQATGAFNWDSQLQGLVLGSFFYGYLVTQIPGGLLAEKYGAKWLLGIGVLITSVLTLLTPLVTRWSVWALIAARVIEGLSEGAAYPAINTLIGQWAPKLERSRMTAFIYSGSNVGTVLTLAISGILCNSNFLGGWPSVFYVFGLLGCIWFILWAILVFETPDSHPRITKNELLLITEGLEEKRNRPPTPWKQIWTSIPFWALLITHVGECWGFYTLVIEMPLYLSQILHYDINENGLLSALPNLTLSIVSISTSILADKIRKSGKLRVTVIRKIFNSIGFFGPAVCLITVALVGCEPLTIVILLSLAMGLNGFAFSGFICTYVDMNPDFAGSLYGISNCFASFTGFLVPAFVGWIIRDGQTVKNWGIVFFTASAVFIVTGIVYDVFSTSELQSWGEDQKANKKESSQEIVNVSSNM